MKKRFAILAPLLFLPALVWGDTLTYLQGVSGEGADYSDILFHWGAENSVDSDKPSGGSAITGTNNGITFVTSPTQPVGSYWAGRTTEWDRIDFTIVEGTHFIQEEGGVAFWYRYDGTTTPSAGEDEILIRYDSSNQIIIEWSTGGDITVKWVGQGSQSTIATNADVIAGDTTVFVVLKWEVGSAGDDLVLTIYNSSGSSIGSASTSSITGMDAEGQNFSVTIGVNSSNTGIFYFDNFIIGNDAARDFVSLRSVTDFN